MFLASTGKGGLETLLVNLCNHLSRRHQVLVMAFDQSQWLDQLDGSVEIVSLGQRKSRYNPMLYIRMLLLIRREQPDIIHAHGGKAAQVLQLIKKFIFAPLVATKHNARKGKVFNHLKHVVAVSSRVAATIRGKSTIIYNGMQPVEITRSPLPDDNFSILAVGRLDRVKAFDLLIQSMVKLPDKITLAIVGDGEERKSLQELINQLELSSRIQLLGFRQDIPQLMANAHMVVVSSHSEGFGLVLAESMFYANLLISTDVGVAPEVLPDELLMESKDMASKLQSINDDYLYFKEIFDRCRNEGKARFHVARMTEAYEKYYRDVLQENN